MSRENRRKIDVGAKAAPALQNPFAELAGIEALRNLPAAPEPEKVAPAPRAEPAGPPRPNRGRLILRRETKDRGGKVVVVVSGFAEGVPGASAVMIADLAKELKGKLGCGGTFDRREIVLQGDRAAQVTELLRQIGFHVRGVTG